MSSDTFHSVFAVGKPPKLQRTSVKLKGVTAHALRVLGTFILHFLVEGVELKHRVFIVDGIGTQMLLGNDFVLDKVTIHHGRHADIVVDEKQTIRVPLNYNIPKMQVRLLENVTLDPFTMQLVKCELQYDQSHTDLVARLPEVVVLDPVDETQSLQPLDAVVRPNELGEISCCLVNDTSVTSEKMAYEVVATATPVSRSESAFYMYEEYHDDGELFYVHSTDNDTLRYVHESEERDHIMHGNEAGFNPIPAGYEVASNEEQKNPADIPTDKYTAPGLGKHTKRMRQILTANRGVFSTGPSDYGCTPLMKFSIETGDNEPVASRYCPIPAAYEPEVRATIAGMLENKIIEEADSPWNSSLVIVRKPNGKLRICVNLKGVNAVTVNKTSYPINNQETSFATLARGKYYFRLDLSQAYYAIPLATEDDKQKTAFSVFGKQYRFLVSPFGARYLPSQFNRLMSNILSGLEHNIFFYFDDVIGVYSTPEELLVGLENVLGRLLAANLRVNFQKSEFYLTELSHIKWLGSVIHDNQICPDQEKIKAISEMPIPGSRNMLQRFLGAVNFHRRHIDHLADRAAPLNKMLSKKVVFKMGPEQVEAFNDLKQALTSAPALALPEIAKPFIITTDASDVGVGGMLSQPNSDGTERVVAYCSRQLTVTEQNGSSCEKEILAILYAVNCFHFYIANTHFTLRSDSKSLVFLRHFKNLNSKIFRASLQLDELSFDIEHMSATRSNAMGVVDMVSRAYYDVAPDPPRAGYKTLRSPVFEKLTSPPKLPKGPIPIHEFNTYADQYLAKFVKDNPLPEPEKSLRNVRYVTSEEFYTLLSTPSDEDDTSEKKILRIRDRGPLYNLRSPGRTPLTLELFKAAQRDDPSCRPIIRELTDNPDTDFGKLFMYKDLLCQTFVDVNDQEHTVVIVPKSLQATVLSYYHGPNAPAHFGRKLLYRTLQQTFAWRGMGTMVKEVCENCPICKYQTPHTQPMAPLSRERRAMEINEVVNIDIVGPFPYSSTKQRYVLTIQCDFSRFVIAVPLPNKEAEGIAKTVVSHWVAFMGRPKFIRSDQGTDCDSSLMQYVCRMLNIKKIRTPSYSPQANPIERWHGTLNRALRSWLHESNYRHWDVVVPLIAHAYNVQVNSVTKIAPYQMVFGRKADSPLGPILPPDHPIRKRPSHEYAGELQKALHIFWALARQRIQEKQAKQHEQIAHKPVREFHKGDTILIRVHAPKHKLEPRWEGPFRVDFVRKNALTCSWWNATAPAKQRLNHHDKDLGQTDVRVVHPKDAKLYNLPMPSTHEFDANFALALAKTLQTRPMSIEELEANIPDNYTITSSDNGHLPGPGEPDPPDPDDPVLPDHIDPAALLDGAGDNPQNAPEQHGGVIDGIVDNIIDGIVGNENANGNAAHDAVDDSFDTVNPAESDQVEGMYPQRPDLDQILADGNDADNLINAQLQPQVLDFDDDESIGFDSIFADDPPVTLDEIETSFEGEDNRWDVTPNPYVDDAISQQTRGEPSKTMHSETPETKTDSSLEETPTSEIREGTPSICKELIESGVQLSDRAQKILEDAESRIAAASNLVANENLEPEKTPPSMKQFMESARSRYGTPVTRRATSKASSLRTYFLGKQVNADLQKLRSQVAEYEQSVYDEMEKKERSLVKPAGEESLAGSRTSSTKGGTTKKEL